MSEESESDKGEASVSPSLDRSSLLISADASVIDYLGSDSGRDTKFLLYKSVQ